MAITYKLEHRDGTPFDPPTFKSAAGTSWDVGDPLYLGRRTLHFNRRPAPQSEARTLC
jgi:hypothetical protein